jgi:hypothetical protein
MTWQPDYVSTEELTTYVRISDTVDDVQAGMAVTAASRAVDDYCGRQFGLVAAPELRRYTARVSRNLGRWVVDIDDLQTVTGLAAAATAGAVTLYDLEPINAAAEGRPWTRLVISDDSAVQPTGEANEMLVTARWGWTAVPVTVKQATLLQASRILSRRNSPYGIAGSPEQGSEVRLLSRIDADVAVLLDAYVRRRWVFA